jgi:DNA-binding MarR family transcriptional regulator
MSRTLQQEIKQSRPFRSPEEEAYLSLIRTADLLARDIGDQLKDYGISETQYNVLRILRGAGPDGHPCSEIGARLITRDPDVTRLLDRMEKRGLATRSRDAADRRVVTIRITPEGLALLDELDGIRRVDELLGHLGPARLEQLIELLAAVREGVAAVTPAPTPAAPVGARRTARR